VLRSGIAAFAVRPADRHDESFATQYLSALNKSTVVVERFQDTNRPDAKKPQWSVILQMFKFAFHVPSCRVYVDATVNEECNPAAFDCTLPKNTWDVYRHHLDPVANKTAANLACSMFKEVNRVLDAGEPIPYQPALPEFFLTFSQRPAFERSPTLRRDAATTMGMVAEHITDAELEEFFNAQCFEQEGETYVPQRYLAHQGSYSVHPVDGSPCPIGGDKAMEWKGLWYFWDGRWNPAGQRPNGVYAHMGNMLGKPFRNPAFTVLKAAGFFAADMTYPQFLAQPDIEGLHQRLLEAFNANSTVTEMLVAGMRQALGRTGNMATDEDMVAALESPDKPMKLSYATNVQLVRYSAPPRPESMTWVWPWGWFNFYSPKKMWTSRTEPAPWQPKESHEHGRALAPVTG
jgi:hypothetical protein